MESVEVLTTEEDRTTWQHSKIHYIKVNLRMTLEFQAISQQIDHTSL